MTLEKPRKTYVDASVFGGVFDDEFLNDSKAFFDQADRGRFAILTSELVADELIQAPPKVRRLYDRILVTASVIQVNESAMALRDAYLNEQIVSAKWSDDALHVVLASVAGADLIVSWNFRHIVHLDKVPHYNKVNRRCGYGEVAIHSPSEVIAYEDEEEI